MKNHDKDNFEPYREVSLSTITDDTVPTYQSKENILRTMNLNPMVLTMKVLKFQRSEERVCHQKHTARRKK